MDAYEANNCECKNIGRRGVLARGKRLENVFILKIGRWDEIS